MTVLGGTVTVLGASVAVSGAPVPVEPESELEPELEVSDELEVLGDTDSEGVVDEDVPLQPVNTKISPAVTMTALLRSFTSASTSE